MRRKDKKLEILSLLKGLAFQEIIKMIWIHLFLHRELLLLWLWLCRLSRNSILQIIIRIVLWKEWAVLLNRKMKRTVLVIILKPVVLVKLVFKYKDLKSLKKISSLLWVIDRILAIFYVKILKIIGFLMIFYNF